MACWLKLNQLRIIVSSTRPSRIGHKVTRWVSEQASPEQWEVKILDLAEIGLPFFDEADMPMQGNYANAHTKAWPVRSSSPTPSSS